MLNSGGSGYLSRIHGVKIAGVALALLTGLLPALGGEGGDWNDAAIGWMSYEDGLEAAGESGRPVCLIFYTDWCPHCRNYSKSFHDPRVVEMSKQFVMVRLNKERNRELSRKYAPDGEYIPRTFFLSAGGELEASLQAPRDRYRYFYDPRNPQAIIDGMERALTRLGKQ